MWWLGILWKFAASCTVAELWTTRYKHQNPPWSSRRIFDGIPTYLRDDPPRMPRGLSSQNNAGNAMLNQRLSGCDRGTRQRTHPNQNRACIARLLWPVHQRRKTAQVIHTQKVEDGNAWMAGGNTPFLWLFVFESLWRTDYNPWHFSAAQKLCR